MQQQQRWADVQDSSQELIQSSPPTLLPPQFSQTSYGEPSQLFNDTPDSFEDNASQVRHRLEQCDVSSDLPASKDKTDVPMSHPEAAGSGLHLNAGRFVLQASEPIQFPDTPDSFEDGPMSFPPHVASRTDEYIANNNVQDGDGKHAPQIQPTTITESRQEWCAHSLLAPAMVIAASSTPIRHGHRQKRTGQPAAVAGSTPKKRQRAAVNRVTAPSKEEVILVNRESPVAPTTSDEEVRQRRLAHRNTGVAAVKRSQDYQRLLQLQAQSYFKDHERPGTPDPQDERVKKRSWESSMQQWRMKLRNLPN